MIWTRQLLFNSLWIIFISIALLLLVDFSFGKHLFPYYFGVPLQDTQQSLRIKDPTYHHTLSPNFKGFDVWGYDRHPVCTNYLGFKDDCSRLLKPDEKVDIAFIGDSFTEGVGLPYEDTFVGQIAKGRPDLRVVNMGVSSYSPTIYLAKVKELLSKGFIFRELVVYVDISDIQDEAVGYRYDNGIVQDLFPERVRRSIEKDQTIKYFFKGKFPLLYTSLSIVKMRIENIGNPKIDYGEDRAAWTYSDTVNGYGDAGVDFAISKSQIMMYELYKLLKENDIKLSIGVYPWPAQILYDQENSRQVQLWENFCKGKCKNFYNSFPTFFSFKKNQSSIEIIEEYFIHGDHHFNARGANLIAKDFLDSYGSLRR
jgi:hypothetical protein